MARFIYTNNSKKGKLGISYNVFDELVRNVIEKSSLISESQTMLKRNQKARLNRPVQTKIHNGIVNIWLAIDIKKNANIQETIMKLQNEIYDSLQMMTDTIPFNIQIKVEKLL